MRYPFDGEYGISDDYQAHVERGSKAPGVDFKTPTGTEIKAAAGGRVIMAGHTERSGYFIRLGHPDELETLYCHLLEHLVRTGQRVSAGQRIGRSGSSGHSTGPHLHFAVWDDVRLEWIDPQPLFDA